MDLMTCLKSKQYEKVKSRQQRKFRNILKSFNLVTTQESQVSISNINSGCFVKNLSSKQLTKDQTELLEKGLNFNISKKKLEVDEIAPIIEPVLRKLDQEKAENLRIQTGNILKGQLQGRPNLTKNEQKALKSLKSDKTIRICRADKGNVTVVMDKKDYDSKLITLLETGPYCQIEKPKSDTVMNKKKAEVALYLRNIKEKIGKEKWYALYPKSSVAPRLYGLPKIHKQDIPLRPIVDGIGSPCHNLSKFLARLIKPLVKESESTIKNSFEFSQKISKLSIEDDEILVSFDIVSLFTNVPQNKVLLLIQKMLQDDETLKDRTRLSVEDICSGLKLCLNMTYFMVNSKLYYQKEGLAMGSPLSPILANIYMQNFESNFLEICGSPPKIWWRYVDDTFVIMKKDNVDSILSELNSFETTIKFTTEKEAEGGLPFLDCLVCRQKNGKLKTTWYRKPTDVTKVLLYSSAHPTGVFQSIVSSMFRRATNLCTEEKDKKVAIRTVFETCLKFGYPKALLNKQLRKIKYFNSETPRSWDYTVALPYKQGTSEAIKRLLNTMNIRVAFRRGHSLSTLLARLKDPIPRDKISNCVYKISCQECDAIYIGQTARELKVRIAEHSRKIRHPPKNEEELNRMQKESAIALHAIETGHCIKFAEVEIVKQGFKTNQERILTEAINIHKSDNTINRQDGLELSDAWRTLIRKTAGLQN